MCNLKVKSVLCSFLDPWQKIFDFDFDFLDVRVVDWIW